MLVPTAGRGAGGPCETHTPSVRLRRPASALRCPKNAAGLRFSLRFSSSPLLSASRTFPPLGESSAAVIPASLLNALPHLPFPGLFHDGPPTARLRRFRSRFICHRQRVTGILPPAARSRNSPGGGAYIDSRETDTPSGADAPAPPEGEPILKGEPLSHPPSVRRRMPAPLRQGSLYGRRTPQALRASSP